MDELTQEAIQEAKDHKAHAEIHYHIEGKLISVATKSYVSSALAYLLIGGYDLRDTAKLTIDIGEDVVKFTITRQLLEYITEFKFSNSEYGGLLDIANLIIYQNDTKLTFYQDDKSVIFEFSLPIWKDEQD